MTMGWLKRHQALENSVLESQNVLGRASFIQFLSRPLYRRSLDSVQSLSSKQVIWNNLAKVILILTFQAYFHNSFDLIPQFLELQT